MIGSWIYKPAAKSPIEFDQSLPLLNSTKRHSISSDYAPLLEYLIRIGCDPDVPEDYGFTPLHLACLHSSDTASVLLRHTNNIYTKSKLGWTPLHLAALGTDVNLAATLIQAGAGLELTLKAPIQEEKGLKQMLSHRNLFVESLTPLGLAVAKATSVTAPLEAKNYNGLTPFFIWCGIAIEVEQYGFLLNLVQYLCQR